MLYEKKILGQVEAVDVSGSSDPWLGSCYSNYINENLFPCPDLSPKVWHLTLQYIGQFFSQHFLECLYLHFKGGILILKMIILHHVKWPRCNEIFLQGANVLLGVSLQAQVIHQLLYCTGCIFLQHLVEHFRTVWDYLNQMWKAISLTQVCN